MQTGNNYLIKFLYLFFKIILSGILALIILTPILKIYNYIPPNPHPKDPDNVTDTKYLPSVNYSNCSEGFSRGSTNNEGYMNLINYVSGMSIDILIMGSSHMEAFQVMPLDNTTNILRNLSKLQIYNVGMRAHVFQTNASHMESALQKYRPKYVIIESIQTSVSDEALNEILIKRASSITQDLAENNAFNTLAFNIIQSFYRNFLKEHIDKYLAPTKTFFASKVFQLRRKPLDENKIYPTFLSNSILLSKVLKKMYDTASRFESKIIIAYHPRISLNKDGSIKIYDNPKARQQFSDLCHQNGIYFLDMSQRFLSEYGKNYTLPYGFFNTSVATGHLNKDGHRMFAEEIYKLIQQIEGKS